MVLQQLPPPSGAAGSPKASRASAHVILHDLRLHHLAILAEIVAELLCWHGTGRRRAGQVPRGVRPKRRAASMWGI